MKLCNNTTITASSGNVYADLGFEHAEELLLKAQLAAAIKQSLEGKNLTQVKAAQVLGLPQPKLSRLLNGHFDSVSDDCLIFELSRGLSHLLIQRQTNRENMLKSFSEQD